MPSEWIAPTIAGVLLLVTTVTGALIGIRNTRTNAVESRAPSAQQSWNETDRARARMHQFEDLFWMVLAALKHLARTVKLQHPEYEFTPDVAEALKAEPPEDEK